MLVLGVPVLVWEYLRRRKHVTCSKVDWRSRNKLKSFDQCFIIE